MGANASVQPQLPNSPSESLQDILQHLRTTPSIDTSEQVLRAVRPLLDVQDAKQQAITLRHVGNACFDNVTAPDRGKCMERAIFCYSEALKSLGNCSDVSIRGGILNNLGNTWRQVPGNQRENMEKALHYFEQSLQIIKQGELPALWAKIKMNFGIAWENRIAGDKITNVENAIHCYEDSLEVRKVENIEKAIEHYEDSLKVKKKEEMLRDWAFVKVNLGIAYWSRIAGDKMENIDTAIGHLEDSLEVMTEEKIPHRWATIKMNLGNAYRSRITGDKKKNIEKAIEHHLDSLKVRTKEEMPVDWARVKMNLGTAYWERIAGNRKKNLEKAIQCYNESLEVMTKEAMPETWAMIKQNLGAAYSDRIEGEQKENIEEAIGHYEDSLQVRTKEGMPGDWALVKGNLGTAWQHRIAGDKKMNIEKAIRHYKDSLEVRTKEKMPWGWAVVKMNLGFSYWTKSIQSARSEKKHTDRAIKNLEDSLTVLTKEAAPYEHMCALIKLGIAMTAVDMERSIAILTKATDASKALLEMIEVGIVHESKLHEEIWSAHVLLARIEAGRGRLEEALTWCETGRAQVLRAMVTERFEVSRYLDDKERDTYITEVDELGKLQHKLKKMSLNHGRESLIEKIKGVKDKPRSLVKKAKQRAGKDRVALIESRAFSFQECKSSFGSDTLIIELVLCAYEDYEHPPYGALAFVLFKDELKFQSFENFANKDMRTCLKPRAKVNKHAKNNSSEDGKNRKEDISEREAGEREAVVKALTAMLDEIFKLVPNCLQEAKRLVIVPHSTLHSVAFHTLEIEIGEGKRMIVGDAFPRGVYILPSLSIGMQLERNADVVRDIRSPGVTDGKTVSIFYENLERVPAFTRIINNAAVLGPKPKHISIKRVPLIIDQIKNELAFCKVFCTYSHGVFASIDSSLHDKMRMIEETGFFYVNNNQEEKVWSIAEIWRLNLKQCRLACIVACDGGAVNAFSSSDECIGVGTAFLVAGAKYVLCSLWPVKEVAAVLIMKRFFANLHYEETSKRSRAIDSISGCLLEAQRWYRESSKEEQISELDASGEDISKNELPDNKLFYNWGSFVIIGPGEKEEESA